MENEECRIENFLYLCRKFSEIYKPIERRKMQKLFFELLRVALGQLDCVDRAPLTEEWYELYRIAKQHGIAGTCYQGVEKLFEFGLRGPQDLMIDWMEESEEAFDADVIEHYSPIPMKNPLKNHQWQKILRDNSDTEPSPTKHLLSLLIHIHEQFTYRRLALLLLLDAFRLLKQIDGRFDKMAHGATFEQQLRKVGIYGFTQGVMWVLGETMGLERKYMPCEPSEKKGRFILDYMMSEEHTLKERLKKRFL